MDITAAAPILEVGYSVGFVVAGAIAALAAVFVAQQVRARCGPCRLPRVTISFKYDDDNEGAGLSRSATLAGAYASTSATPLPIRATLFGALAYFVLPFDAIPDFLLGLGFTDDAAILVAAFTAARMHITQEHRARARAWLLKEQGRAPGGPQASPAG